MEKYFQQYIKIIRGKKMIYIISPFESKIEARGTRNIELSNLLVKNGYEVTFITSNFSHQIKSNYSTNDMYKKLTDEKYTSKILDVPPYFSNLSLKRMITHIVFAYKMYKYLYKNIKYGDTVLTSSIPPELTLSIYLLKKKKNFNSIVDVRDIWPDAFPLKNNVIGKLFSFYCNFIYKMTLKSFDKIVYVAYSFDYWISKYTTNEEKVMISLGYDLERWKNIEYKSKSKEINLIYIGNLSYQFDISLIVDFVNRNSNYKFHIIGDGDTFNDIVNKSTTSKNMFYGRCSPDKVVEIASKADIAILPIKEDSTAYMPNKLFDYLGASIPILSLGMNDSSKFIENNDIGWIVKYDIDDITNLLLSISSKDINLKYENVSRIREDYSKDFIYKTFLDVIKSFENGESK